MLLFKKYRMSLSEEQVFHGTWKWWQKTCQIQKFWFTKCLELILLLIYPYKFSFDWTIIWCQILLRVFPTSTWKSSKWNSIGIHYQVEFKSHKILIENECLSLPLLGKCWESKFKKCQCGNLFNLGQGHYLI